MDYLSLASLIVGLAARVFVPWLIARRENPDLKWNWKKVYPQVVSFGILMLLLPLLVDDLKNIIFMEPQAAWLLGWGAADLGRNLYKALLKENQ